MTSAEKIFMQVMDTITTIAVLFAGYVTFIAITGDGPMVLSYSAQAAAISLVALALNVVAHQGVMRRIASEQLERGATDQSHRSPTVHAQGSVPPAR